MRIVHIINTLSTGGAESSLERLVSHMNGDGYENYVISLSDTGRIGARLQQKGVEVAAIDMRRKTLKSLFLLASELRRYGPDIVHTWMYHSNLIGGLVARLATRGKVIWNVRHNNIDLRYNKLTTILAIFVTVLFSRWVPDRIVFCSERSRNMHVKLGYPEKKTSIIYNGFVASPRRGRANLTRSSLEIGERDFVIGMVARYDRLKGFPVLIKAAELFIRTWPNTRFLLAGHGVTWQNDELAGMIGERLLDKFFRLVGEVDDSSIVFGISDIVTLSSYSEAFPNVVAEGMMQAVPCVVTDVGEASRIVGETGIVVRPDDASALAEGWTRLIRMDRSDLKRLGQLARDRVRQQFGITTMIEAYARLYLAVV